MKSIGTMITEIIKKYRNLHKLRNLGNKKNMGNNIIISDIGGLPGFYVTEDHVYDMTSRSEYWRYTLYRVDKQLLDINSPTQLSNKKALYIFTCRLGVIVGEMLEIYNSPAWDTLKEYNETLKSIDKLD